MLSSIEQSYSFREFQIKTPNPLPCISTNNPISARLRAESGRFSPIPDKRERKGPGATKLGKPKELL
jgi:DNA-directed RNA polymerase subunit H (RpoH/RPB5)